MSKVFENNLKEYLECWDEPLHPLVEEAIKQAFISGGACAFAITSETVADRDVKGLQAIGRYFKDEMGKWRLSAASGEVRH